MMPVDAIVAEARADLGAKSRSPDRSGGFALRRSDYRLWLGPDDRIHAIWIWSTGGLGYGQVRHCGKMTRVMRLVHNIPEGQVARHIRCPYKRCILHIRAGSKSDDRIDTVRDWEAGILPYQHYKVTSAMRQQFRDMSAAGYTQQQIAEWCEVGQSTVADHLTGKKGAWRDDAE